jgi:hypothetical protein
MKTDKLLHKSMTRADIYLEAISNFKGNFPELNPYREIADRLFMAEQTLRAKIHGDRSFTIPEEEMFFRVCNYPKAYDLIKQRIFLSSEDK